MRLRFTIFMLLLAGIVIVPSSQLLAQYAQHYGGSGTGQPSLWIDNATFVSDSTDQMRLEVYYKIFNFGLTFEKNQGRYTASYEVSISVEDKDRNPVATYSTEKDVVVNDHAKSRSASDFRSSQANFNLEPGKYRLKFSIRDGNSSSVYKHDFSIRIKLPDLRQARLSSIEFVQQAEPAEERTNVFVKREHLVIPSVSKDYEGGDDARLTFYVETYRKAGDSSRLVLETRIITAGGKIRYLDTLALEPGVATQYLLQEIPTNELVAGEQTLELTLRGRRNRKLDQISEKFMILWSQSSMLRNGYDEAMRQLDLIASGKEFKAMRKLKEYSERLIAYDKFWRDRDPSPETPRNEAKIEFYRRIAYANRSFRYLRQAGWSTDRGRIYVEHGEPDEVEDVPMAIDAYPYQLWHYYRNGRYLRFLFVDEDLDGDFRLQFPYDGTGQRPDF